MISLLFYSQKFFKFSYVLGYLTLIITLALEYLTNFTLTDNNISKTI